MSHYQLTLEPGTAFERRPPPLPDDEAAFAMQVACQARLAAAGLPAIRGLGIRGGTGASAATTSTTGASAITSASVRARTASSRDPVAGAVVRPPACGSLHAISRPTQPPERVEESREVPVRRPRVRVLPQCAAAGRGIRRGAVRVADRAFMAIGRPVRVAVAERKGLLRAAPGGRWLPTSLGRRFLNDLQAFSCRRRPPARQVTHPGGLALAARDRLGAEAVIHTSTAGTQIRHVTSCSRSDMLGDDCKSLILLSDN